VLPLLGLVAIAAGILLWARHLRRQGDTRGANLVLFAALWILLPLAPVLYTKPLLPLDFAHARYLYMPAIGFGLLIALAIRRLPSAAHEVFGLPVTQGASAAIIILALAAGTATQQVYWANNLLLFARGVSIAPHNPSALTNLAAAMGNRRQYDRSIPLLEEALRQDPRDWYANFILGNTYYTLGRYREAEPHFQVAVLLHPDDFDPEQFMYLALTARRLGKPDEAEWAVRQAVRRRPDHEQYRYGLALILEERGKLAEAVPEFQAVLKINPDNADARARLVRIQATLQH
jgi:tetratricopeptide (TPR) repeat protein